MAPKMAQLGAKRPTWPATSPAGEVRGQRVVPGPPPCGAWPRAGRGWQHGVLLNTWQAPRGGRPTACWALYLRSCQLAHGGVHCSACFTTQPSPPPWLAPCTCRWGCKPLQTASEQVQKAAWCCGPGRRHMNLAFQERKPQGAPSPAWLCGGERDVPSSESTLGGSQCGACVHTGSEKASGCPAGRLVQALLTQSQPVANCGGGEASSRQRQEHGQSRKRDTTVAFQ